MDIRVRLAFDEAAAVRLLNWLAQENAEILSVQPDLPALYLAGVEYRREREETWCDYINLLLQGHEDCDALAAARAGELIARGAKALGPKGRGFDRTAPGGFDGGHAEARRRGLRSIHAEVELVTRVPLGSTGLYHCVVRYRVGGRWYRDDPSARLGMYDYNRRPS